LLHDAFGGAVPDKYADQVTVLVARV